jgi:hypothetical protein
MDDLSTTGTGDRAHLAATKAGRSRTRTLAAGATISVVTLLGTVLGGGPALAATAGPASPPMPAVPATAAPSPSSPRPAAVTGLPTGPTRYATAAFGAWRHGNDARLSRLATPSVATFLAAHTPDRADAWSGPTCESAAGTTSCTWSETGAQLTLRVANDAAARGRKHAVVEALFTPPAGGVAVWPFTTAEQATTTQAAVDEGHQPWLVSSESVAMAYANGVLDWPAAVIDSEDPEEGLSYRLTDPNTLTVVDVTMAQPARPGFGGIWAVVQVTSAD